MSNSNSHISNGHVEEWQLAYLEDLLSPDEISRFERHLEQCADCAKQLEEMSGWISLLKSNKAALCPEESELFDYACGRKDATGVLASHLVLCSSCRNTLESFEACTHQGRMPDALWKKMTRLDKPPARETTRIRYARLYGLWEQLLDLFSPPLALAGAVAVGILAVVLLVPFFSTSGPFLGLSSVAWAPDSSVSNLMGVPGAAPPEMTRKERLAVIIYFENFGRKPDRERIDDFYRLLDPGRDVRLHYDVVSPCQIKEAVESAGMKGDGREEILHVLKDKLSVSRTVILELSQKRGLFSVDASLTDNATGAVVGRRKISHVREARLSEELEAAADSVLKTK
jgi:hypothetical protein